MNNLFFTSRSIERNPSDLFQQYNQLLKKSLSSQVVTASKGLQKNLKKLNDYLLDLDIRAKINPEFHTINYLLSNALEKNDAIEVSKLINRLSEVCASKPYMDSFEIKTFSLNALETPILEDLKERNRNKEGKLPSLEPVTELQKQELSSKIVASLNLIQNVSSEFFEEFQTYVSNLKLFISDRLVGMTDPRLFGTIYLCTPPKDMPAEIYFCEHIIHETSHLHLYTLFALDRLILNDPNERYSAPIRPDPRPMYGIFHATFVLSRMVRIFGELSKKFQLNGFDNYLSNFTRQFFSGYNTVKEHAKLTEMGKNIFNSYSDILINYK